MQALPRTASYRRSDNPPPSPPPPEPERRSRKRARSRSRSGGPGGDAAMSEPTSPPQPPLSLSPRMLLKRPILVSHLLREEEQQEICAEWGGEATTAVGLLWRETRQQQQQANNNTPVYQPLLLISACNSKSQEETPHRPPLRVSNSNSPRRRPPPPLLSPPSPHQKEASSVQIGQHRASLAAPLPSSLPENMNPPARKRMRARSAGGARGTENLPKVGPPARWPPAAIKAAAGAGTPFPSVRPSRRPKVRH
jgi:hypothetical protein